MHVAVLGAGALGTLFGTRIWLGGEVDVTLIGLGPHVEEMKTQGVTLVDMDGSRSVVSGPGLRVVEGAAEVGDPIDYLFVTVKGPDFAKALTSVGDLPPVGCALTLQNGIRFEPALRESLGEDRVIGAVTMEGAAVPEPGTVHHILPAVTFLGESGKAVSARVTRLAEAMARGGLPTEPVDDIASAIWTKYVQSCAASGVCGVTRLGYAPATATAAGADLYVRLVREGLAVMRAVGIEPGPYLGDAASVIEVDRNSDADAAALVRQTAEGLIAAGYIGGTSLLRDLEAGHPSEAPFLMGDMAQTAAEHGVPAPTMAAVYLAVAAADQSR